MESTVGTLDGALACQQDGDSTGYLLGRGPPFLPAGGRLVNADSKSTHIKN
jgi:hypothetical protein